MSSDPQIRHLIDKLADAVRSLYGITAPIDDIDETVKKIGGTVVEDASMDGFSDGRIRKLTARSFEIAVSPFQSKERRNFTVAHELGHLFLHMGFMTDEDRWQQQDSVAYYRGGRSELEYQANEFAAAFLMPQWEYESVLKEHTEGNLVDTAEIARYFHVSIDAAANRGKWLGYLGW